MRRRAFAGIPAQALLQATFFEAHVKQQRVITDEHLHAATARLGSSATAVDELRALVKQDQLPLVRLLQTEPLQMQAFHLSFQEFYAMRALVEGGARSLPDFRIGDVWWTNAVLMGVQTGDAVGVKFIAAAGLEVAPSVHGASKEAAWRLRTVAALVGEGGVRPRRGGLVLCALRRPSPSAKLGTNSVSVSGTRPIRLSTAA